MCITCDTQVSIRQHSHCKHDEQRRNASMMGNTPENSKAQGTHPTGFHPQTPLETYRRNYPKVNQLHMGTTRAAQNFAFILSISVVPPPYLPACMH